MSPTFRFGLARGEAFWLLSGTGASGAVNWNRGLNLLCFLLRLLWACGQRLGVVQGKRHVHSVTGSGLSGGLPGSAQALAGEVEPMGIVDEAITSA